MGLTNVSIKQSVFLWLVLVLSCLTARRLSRLEIAWKTSAQAADLAGISWAHLRGTEQGCGSDRQTSVGKATLALLKESNLYDSAILETQNEYPLKCMCLCVQWSLLYYTVNGVASRKALSLLNCLLYFDLQNLLPLFCPLIFSTHATVFSISTKEFAFYM